MATLTYGKTFPTDMKTAKTHLDRMTAKLHRHGINGVWVAEFQERGAVHFHLIMSRSLPPSVFGRMWFESTSVCINGKVVEGTQGLGDRDVHSVHAHPKCQSNLRKLNGAAAYAAGYAAKNEEQKTVPEGFQWSGRWWGKWGLPDLEHRDLNATVNVHAPLLRTLRRADQSRRRANHRANLNKSREDYKQSAQREAKRHLRDMGECPASVSIDTSALSRGDLKARGVRVPRTVRRSPYRGSRSIYGVGDIARRLTDDRTRQLERVRAVFGGQWETPAEWSCVDFNVPISPLASECRFAQSGRAPLERKCSSLATAQPAVDRQPPPIASQPTRPLMSSVPSFFAGGASQHSPAHSRSDSRVQASVCLRGGPSGGVHRGAPPGALHDAEKQLTLPGELA
jgi:hypothetical protein